MCARSPVAVIELGAPIANSGKQHFADDAIRRQDVKASCITWLSLCKMLFEKTIF